MKYLMTFSLLMAMSSTVMAQKPTAAKQDEILKKQELSEENLQKVLENQELLIGMYGSQMDIENEIDRMSYAYGLSIGVNMISQGITQVNYQALSRGLIDAIVGRDAMMTPEDAQKFLNEYIGSLMQIKIAETKKKGAAFLEENGKRPEVKTTASGLQYEVIQPGSGANPAVTSKVTVHYEGSLLDGSVFDSSMKRGKPATFALNQVIKGWTEGLQLMQAGAKYRFYIPSDLAYGDQGAGNMIGPGETLIFDVELISIE